MTDKLFRLTFYCPHCDRRHTHIDSLANCLSGVKNLLEDGEVKSVLVEDETLAKERDLDDAEQATLGPLGRLLGHVVTVRVPKP